MSVTEGSEKLICILYYAFNVLLIRSGKLAFKPTNFLGSHIDIIISVDL